MSTEAPGRLASPLTEQLGPVPARWYVLTTEGLATLCATESDARTVKAHADVAFPLRGPHRVALLGDAAAERERCIAECRAVAAQHQGQRGMYQAGREHGADECVRRLVEGPNVRAKQP